MLERRTKEQQNRLELVVLLCAFALSVFVRYLLNSFPKALETYGDEAIYYDIARRLFNGAAINVRNGLPGAAFQKILYSVVMAPCFAIRNGFARVRMIGVLNAVLMSSCMFPVWLIGKELRLNRRDRLIAACALAVWPDMLLTMTFMAENLYWTVVTWYLYLWVVNERRQSYALAVLEGVVCFAGYLTKEVYLAVVVARVAYALSFPLVRRILAGKAAGSLGGARAFAKRLVLAAIVVLTFIACNTASTKLLFVRTAGGYSGAVDTSSAWTLDRLLYLVYATLYYIAGALMSVLVIPFAYSLAEFRGDLDDEGRGFFYFISLILVVTAGAVALTITFLENYGELAPRVHLRYLGPVAFLYLICYLKAGEAMEARDPRKPTKGRNAVVLALVCIVAVFYKGTTMGSSVDQYTLHWYTVAQGVLARMGITGGIGAGIRLEGIQIAILMLLMAAVALALRARGKHRLTLVGFLACMLALCAVNYTVGSRYTTLPYRIDATIADGVERMDDYFQSVGDDESKLYITLGSGNSELAQCFDTYFDDTDQLMVVNSDMLGSMGIGTSYDVAGLSFVEPLFHVLYESPETLDYIILDRDVSLGEKGFVGMDVVPEASSDHYTVYKNNHPETVEIGLDAEIQGRCEVISFAGDGYNADRYVLSGISVPEEGFSWTDGDAMRVEFPTDGDQTQWDVAICVGGTFNGAKSYALVDCRGEEIQAGALDGAGMILFTAPSSDGVLSFEMRTPDSEYVYEAWPGSADQRKLAFQMVKILISAHED